MHVQAEIVTPQIAATYLQNNTKNRPIIAKHLEKLIHEMKTGAWQSNGDTIRFSISGTLLDGQHRLMAIVKSGVSQQMIVVRGLDDDSFVTIDTGSSRKASDVIALEGFTNYNVVASISRMAILFDRNGQPLYSRGGSDTPTNSEILNFAKQNPTVQEAACFGASCKFIRQYMGQTLAGYVWFMAVRAGERDTVTDFFSDFSVVTADGINTPAFMLRERLIADKSAREKMGRANALALIIKAYKHYRSGTKVKILKVVRRGETKEKQAYAI